jgi:acetyl-CoA C-acetyltransferase
MMGEHGRLRRGGACRRIPRSSAINHVHHAGNSSGIVDGAGRGADRHARRPARSAGLKPRARIRAFADHRHGAGDHADRPGRRDREGAGQRRHDRPRDIDLFEVNEAFAAVVLRYMQAFGVDHDKINVNGGAIAHGPSARRHRRDDPRHRARRARAHAA